MSTITRYILAYGNNAGTSVHQFATERDLYKKLIDLIVNVDHEDWDNAIAALDSDAFEEVEDFLHEHAGTGVEWQVGTVEIEMAPSESAFPALVAAAKRVMQCPDIMKAVNAYEAGDWHDAELRDVGLAAKNALEAAERASSTAPVTTAPAAPSLAALRAAKAIEENLVWGRQATDRIIDRARIIDRETGAPDLAAACERAFHVFENDTPRKREILAQIAVALAKNKA